MQIPSMLPLLSSPLAYFFFRAFSGRCVTLPRAVGQRSLAPRPRVSTAFPPVRMQTQSLPVAMFPLQRCERQSEPYDVQACEVTSCAWRLSMREIVRHEGPASTRC
jgi:hypothetical protein